MPRHDDREKSSNKKEVLAILKNLISKKKEENIMAFLYEEVGEENRKLWDSIGWKDWGMTPIKFLDVRHWSIDREKGIYLMAIGGFRDLPFYYDLAYEGRIVRMEVFQKGEGNISVGATFHWKIKRIYIPKSLWSKKDEVVDEIVNAFSVVRNAFPIEKVRGIYVEIQCEPECVEVDYNGR